MYSGMTRDALDWQKKIKKFVDNELIPWEVHAELNNGEIPNEIEQKHIGIARSFGLPGMGVSKEEGGLGLSMLEQMIIWEQLGRVTNALGWCFPEVQDWMIKNCNDYQKEKYLKPLLKVEKRECYAITEKGAGSDVEGSIESTAEKKNNEYVINGEKWYVTGANKADFFFVQAKIKGGSNEGTDALFLSIKIYPELNCLKALPLVTHTHFTIQFINLIT